MFATNTHWLNRIGLAIIFVTATLIMVDRFALWPALEPVANLLYAWVLVMAAFTLLLGIAGVVWNHLDRIRRGESEWSLSLLLVISLSSVLVVGLLSPGGTTGPLLEWTFDALIAPGQASLFALTGFFILAAAYRYLRLDRSDALWVLTGTLLALFVQTPLTQQVLPPIFVTLADWLLVWPVMAALRGALLGGALAVLLVGVRLLAGRGK
jgi:hypothetical protein